MRGASRGVPEPREPPGTPSCARRLSAAGPSALAAAGTASPSPHLLSLLRRRSQLLLGHPLAAFLQEDEAEQVGLSWKENGPGPIHGTWTPASPEGPQDRGQRSALRAGGHVTRGNPSPCSEPPFGGPLGPLLSLRVDSVSGSWWVGAVSVWSLCSVSGQNLLPCHQ